MDISFLTSVSFCRLKMFLLSFFLCFSILYKLVASSGLYTSDASLAVLDSTNFTDFVKSQPTLVQFYLHTCGSCINYAPVFANLTKSIQDWRWAVKVAVIDCANKANRFVREQYGITTFPSFRLFLKDADTVEIEKIYDENTFRTTISETLVNKNQYKQLIPSSMSPNSYMICGPDVNEVAMLILDFQLRVPRSLQSGKADSDDYRIVDENGSVLFSSPSPNTLRKNLAQTYQVLHQEPKKDAVGVKTSDAEPVVTAVTYSMPVYAVDVIASLQNLLVHDVTLKPVIKGEELSALKEFLTILTQYLDLGRQYNEEIAHLKIKVDEEDEVTSYEWKNLLENMKLSTDKVDFIACRGSKPFLRGYPCGLWIMFHSMTVNRYVKGEDDASAPIAHALNRFVPRFFSCGYCAFHFAKMTSNVRRPGEAIYPERPGVEPPFPLEEPNPATLPTPPKSARDEVLWLNKAHNLVNKRLSATPSDDPSAPKAFFPSPQQCLTCWSEEALKKLANDKFGAMPDKEEEVLAYLVHHYRPASWRWDGVYVSFEDISRSNLGGTGFSTGDLVLVGFICVCCAAALIVLFGLLCCRWRCSRKDHLPLQTASA